MVTRNVSEDDLTDMLHALGSFRVEGVGQDGNLVRGGLVQFKCPM